MFFADKRIETFTFAQNVNFSSIMKQRNKVILTGVCIILCCIMFKKKDKRDLNDLSLANIEALAQKETPPIFVCIGTGTIDCHGDKVKFMIDNYRLR